MNSYSVVQFITLFVYAALLVIVIQHTRTRQKIHFLVYLLASMAWSLSSFMAHTDYAVGQKLLWARLIPVMAVWAVVAYSHFVTTYLNRGIRIIPKLGYAFLAVVALLAALGYIPGNIADFGGGTVASDYGNWLYLLTLGSAFFVVTAVFFMIKSYRASRDPRHRNKIAYLLFGIGLLVVFGSLFEALPLQKYAVDHLGHLGNAVLITLAILKYQLLDMRVVVRKGLVYSGLTVTITTVYLLMLAALQRYIEGIGTALGMGTIIASAVVMAWLFNPLRLVVHQGVERLFYGKSYDYRQMMLSYSQRMSNVLDIGQLAEAMLQPIIRVMRASQVSLLLVDKEGFSTRFAERLAENEPFIPIKIRDDSPLITWLELENRPLSREVIDVTPEFKGLWEVDRNALEAARVELLYPIKARNSLVGILALSKKSPRGFYSQDDTDLIATLVNGAGVVIENAQLYAQAKRRANVDELTGLYNHRYFHERLSEEIARSSRFGEVFSLLVLDIDLFKAYNDVHGHLKGDELLRQIGQHIRNTTRQIGICFR